MSETRPPITAGPIERAFKFLKRTSVNWGGVDEGVGVTEEDKSALGEDEGVGDAAIGVLADGVCSCAVKIEIDENQANSTWKKPDRVVIGCRL
jgi:hypothetical protein